MKKRVIVVFSLFFIIILNIFLLSACKISGTEQNSNIEYNMNISLDDAAKIVTVNQKIEYRPVEDNEKVILIMNSNVFSDKLLCEDYKLKYAYPEGASYGKTKIENLTVNGTESQYSLNGNILDINTHIKKNKNTVIEIFYFLTLPNTALRYGYNNIGYNLANFYPMIAEAYEYSIYGDPFVAPMAKYNVNVKCAEYLTVIGSGEVEYENTANNTREIKLSNDNARDFALVISPVYTKHTDKAGGISVNYYSYSDPEPDVTLKLAVSVMNTFSELYGRYVGESVNICETNFAYGGMEFSNLIYVASTKSKLQREQVVIHELAHGWWYHGVGSDQFKHAWQDEGITDYSVMAYYRAVGESEIAEEFKQNNRISENEYKKLLNSVGLTVDNIIDKPLDKFSNSFDYIYATYIRGYRLFELLDDIIGEENMMKALKSYYKEWSLKIASPENIINSFEKTYKGSGKIIDLWINGNV